MTKKLLAPSAFVLVLVLAVYGCNSPDNDAPATSTTPIPAEDAAATTDHSGHDQIDSHAGHDSHAGDDHAGHDQSAKKTDMEKMTGSLASFSPKDRASAMKQHFCPVSSEMLGTMGAPEKVEGHMLHMNVELSGVGPQPLAFHAMGKVSSGDKLSDEVLILLQGVCPVSGQKLGSMGKPPKVMVGGKPLFICCAGCKSKVESSPDQYPAKFYSAKGEEVRPGVFKATLADTKAIAAQKVCAVMDEPLGGMGTPLKVNVKGKAVFICCAGCAKKLAAEPGKYLQQLAKAGVKPPTMN